MYTTRENYSCNNEQSMQCRTMTTRSRKMQITKKINNKIKANRFNLAVHTVQYDNASERYKQYTNWQITLFILWQKFDSRTSHTALQRKYIYATDLCGAITSAFRTTYEWFTLHSYSITWQNIDMPDWFVSDNTQLVSSHKDANYYTLTIYQCHNTTTTSKNSKHD